MLKFYDIKFKEDLIKCFKYFEPYNCNGYNKYFQIVINDLDIDLHEITAVIDYIQLIKCSKEYYSEAELYELGLDKEDEIKIVYGNSIIELYLDESESLIECELYEFINLIEKLKYTSINDDGICISDDIAIIRVIPIDYDYVTLEDFPCFNQDLIYNEINININIYKTNNLFALKNFFDGNLSEYFPVILNDDLFIEMSFNSQCEIKNDDINEIYNAYVFEILKSHDIKLNMNPRPSFEDYEYDSELEAYVGNENLKPLLFGKGMNDVITLFNGAEGTIDDRAIVEYTKVIEYVGATIVNKEIILKAQKKLNDPRVLKPEADYIKELEKLFLDNKRKYSKDSAIIMATIKECCEILTLVEHSPKFIKSLYDLKRNIQKDILKRNEFIEIARNNLAQSVSNTRNNLSHAKANYDIKGLECPDTQKSEFVVLLRHICIQTIEWFYEAEESIKIIKHE